MVCVTVSVFLVRMPESGDVRTGCATPGVGVMTPSGNDVAVEIWWLLARTPCRTRATLT
jgi:hypothetical protein